MFEMLKEYFNTIITDEEFTTATIHKDCAVLNCMCRHLTPTTKESYYYRKTYDANFTFNSISTSHLVEHIWLPKFSGNIIEPSARILATYSKI